MLMAAVLCRSACAEGDAARSWAFFRLVAPTSTSIIVALDGSGTMAWSNGVLGGTGLLQRATQLAASGNWIDYTQVVLSNDVMTARVFDASPPPGMILIPAGVNSGTDPNFGPYRLAVAGFYMDRGHITKALWDEVCMWAATNGYPDLPPGQAGGVGYPVDSVNWYDAVKWCNARSEMEKRPAVYRLDSAVYRAGDSDVVVADARAAGYRLPTVTEWEYAARGGLRGKAFPWGDAINASRANYDFHVDHTTVAGTYPSNGYGAYDMAGNLWQWTWERHADPRYENMFRTMCGGSWLEPDHACRCGHRGFSRPGIPSYGIGFRTVLSDQ